MTQQTIYHLLITLIPLIFAITVHETAHGWVAYRLGDKTAYFLGRLTLNPLKHIDPIGTVVLPLVMVLLTGMAFGWAKPVPVNANQLRNPRWGMALVSLAGPLSNLLMAFFWAFVAKLGQSASGYLFELLVLMGFAGITINVVFLLINLIPLPPVDGSRVVAALLPPRLSMAYNRLEPWGIWILYALMLLGGLRWLTPWIIQVSTWIRQCVGVTI